MVTGGKSKQPYCFEVNDGELFAFAGLWDRWKDLNGNWIRTCYILTTTPNAVTSAVHDRMPAILPREQWSAWLDPLNEDSKAVAQMLVTTPSEQMERYRVCTDVNKVANDTAECVRAIEAA